MVVIKNSLVTFSAGNILSGMNQSLMITLGLIHFTSSLMIPNTEIMVWSSLCVQGWRMKTAESRLFVRAY